MEQMLTLHKTGVRLSVIRVNFTSAQLQTRWDSV